MIKKVAIIGLGNVGSFLAPRLKAAGLEVQVFSRKAVKGLSKSLEQYQGDFDLSLLCVPDDAIASLSGALAISSGIVAHSSGTVSIEQIDPKHSERAIFYPLMSLKADADIPLTSIPFCFEASSSLGAEYLSELGNRLALDFRFLNSKERARIHLAAVISQNFSNHLFHWAYQVLKEKHLDFNILKPLLMEHLKGLGEVDPAIKQTGPAVRGDVSTQAKHLEQIKAAEYKDLYQRLSALIQKTHEKEL